MGDDLVQDADEGSGWSSDQVSRFFDAFQEHGQNWAQVRTQRQPECLRVVSCYSSLALQVAQLVGKTAPQSEALYKQHSLYLNLASQLIQKEAFMGMVKGYQEHNSQASTAAAVVLLLQHFLHIPVWHSESVLWQQLALTLGLHACRISCRLLTAQTSARMCEGMVLAAAQQALLKCTLPVTAASTARLAITSSPGNLHLCQRCAYHQTSNAIHMNHASHVCHGRTGLAEPYMNVNRHIKSEQ